MPGYVKAIVVVLAGASVLTAAQAQNLKYAKFSTPLYLGTRAQPSFTGEGVKFLRYKSQIREQFATNAIAAGHYTIISFGCGSSCSINLVGDIRSGRILEFPISGEEFPASTIETDPKSRIFTARWSNIAFTTCTTRTYVFDGLHFIQRERDRFENKFCE